MEKESKQLYKIDPDSEVKGTADGHKVVTTTPDHKPGSEGGRGYRLPEHKKTYVPLHIIQMENSIGRNLRGPANSPGSEEVHHKDGNPNNNAISNLELMTHEDHAQGHAHKKKFWKKSPRTKPGEKREQAKKVCAKYLDILYRE